MINNIRKRKTMTIEEKIKEEQNYTNFVEGKIKQFKAKSKNIKDKTQKKENQIEFLKEINYFKSKQKKLENEILIILSNIDDSFTKKDSQDKSKTILDEFYELINLEKSVQSVFNKNCLIVHESIKKGKEKEFLKKNVINEEPVLRILDYLKNANNQIINIDKSEADFVLEIDNNENLPVKKKNQYNEFIFRNDYFNIFEIYDYSYISSLEKIFNEEIALLTNNSVKQTLENLINFFDFEPYFYMDRVNLPLKDSLLLKAETILSKEEFDEILKNYESQSELIFMKHNSKIKENLMKQFNILNELEKKISLNKNERMKFQNIFIFFKISLLNRKKFTSRIEFEFPRNLRDQISIYEKIVTTMYNLKQNKKIVYSEYIKELAETSLSTTEYIEEFTRTKNEKILKNIEKMNFKAVQEEMDEIHKKNRENFEIKRKREIEVENIKKEKIQLENQKKKEKLEEYYNEIKGKAEINKEKKKEIKQIERKKMEEELYKKEKQIKEEIKKNKPKVEYRQEVALIDFVNQYKAKEIEKNIKLEREKKLEEIILNLKERPNVSKDPERVLQITECLKLRSETTNDEADKVVLFKVNGFNINQLMGDVRYKISNALQEAGLYNTPYAQNLINDLSNKLKK